LLLLGVFRLAVSYKNTVGGNGDLSTITDSISQTLSNIARVTIKDQ